MKSQGDSFFPTDGHKAILNKLNSKSKTNRKRTNITRVNHNRSIALERSVMDYFEGGGGGEDKPVLRSSNLTLGSAVVRVHI